MKAMFHKIGWVYYRFPWHKEIDSEEWIAFLIYSKPSFIVSFYICATGSICKRMNTVCMHNWFFSPSNNKLIIKHSELYAHE